MGATGECLVRVERAGRLLVVRMCREGKRNAVNRQLADELAAAFNLLEDDQELWVGVLTGTSTVFSAGSDLAEELGWQLTADAQATVGESEDLKEGIAAFFEKRPPRWTGR